MIYYALTSSGRDCRWPSAISSQGFMLWLSIMQEESWVMHVSSWLECFKVLRNTGGSSNTTAQSRTRLMRRHQKIISKGHCVVCRNLKCTEAACCLLDTWTKPGSLHAMCQLVPVCTSGLFQVRIQFALNKYNSARSTLQVKYSAQC